MTKMKALVALAAAGLASNALAENSERSYLYVGGVGVIQEDRIEEGDNGFGGMVGYGIPLSGTNFDLEFTGFYNSLKTETSDDRDFQKALMFDAIYRLDRSNMDRFLGFTPYFLGGLGIIQEELQNDSEAYLALEVGAGMRHFLNAHGTAVRGDVRLQEVFNYRADQDTNEYLDVRFNIGLEVPLSPRQITDSDGDGVNDTLDRCPNTPAGVTVTTEGCEADDDFDGVVNSLDKCPRTPSGVPVDSTGCSADSDLDGVLDAYDECPDTPADVQVNARGCALGQDADADGVADSVDRCPGTSAGIAVDTEGCAIKQTFVIEGVNFEFNSARLTPNAKIVLQDVVDTLAGQPELRVEIAGHTDSKGLAEYNKQLSQERAQSVKRFLVDNGIDADRLKAVGYGETKPRADNDTQAGREENRRVEFSVL